MTLLQKDPIKVILLKSKLANFLIGWYLVIFFCPFPLSTQERYNSIKYTSDIGGLETHKSSNKIKTKTYTLYQLMNLKKALAPHYVHVLDQEGYAQSGKILQKGILFSYGNHKINTAYLSGEFNNWSKIKMRPNLFGVFFHVLALKEREGGQKINTYRYKYISDSVWTHDPNNDYKVSDGMGTYLSIFQLEKQPVNRLASVRILKEKQSSDQRLVEFAIHLPNIKKLSLVGNFNNWNPEHDPMLPDKSGTFRRRLRLFSGQYTYKFIADGKWVLDTFNENTRFDPEIQELCSFLYIP